MNGRIWLKLDAQYPDDDRILELDDLEELLFLRGLALAKRTASNGLIRPGQLKRILPGALPASAADHLVEVGLWVTNEEPLGWRIRGMGRLAELSKRAVEGRITRRSSPASHQPRQGRSEL